MVKDKKNAAWKIQCQSKLVLCIIWAMLAVAFEEFGVVYMFKLLFSFYYNFQLVKGQI